MRSFCKVAWHAGWICVKYTDTDFFKPIRYHIYWPVKQCPKSDADYLIGREAGESGSGRYGARTDDYPRGYFVELPLLNGGQTMPIHSEEEPIPVPKVRRGIETRYRNGKWEKYLKAQGWVSA